MENTFIRNIFLFAHLMDTKPTDTEKEIGKQLLDDGFVGNVDQYIEKVREISKAGR